MRADVVIVGGGITGLGTARLMEVDACLFEKETRLGGCLRTDYVQQYAIDRTGHLLHFRDPYVRRIMFQELSLDWLHFERHAQIHILDRRIPYPIQYNLHALPPAVRANCLQSYLALSGAQPSPESSFESWSRASYGEALHELFFEPYNCKLWQTDQGFITAEWTSRFVPLPNRELVVRGALSGDHTSTFGYNATFSYPRKGGTGTIVDALATSVAIPIYTSTELVAIDLNAKVCEFSNGARVHYSLLVNTIPLPSLIRRIHGVDSTVFDMTERLRHNSVFYFAFGFRTGGNCPDTHWVYVPERHYSVYRIGTLSNYSPFVAPNGSTLVCAEIAYPGDTAARVEPASMRDCVLKELETTGFLKSDSKLEFEHLGAIECAYVIFDEHRRESLPRVLTYLEQHGIYSIGRYGAWGYGSMGDALIEGRNCATMINRRFKHRDRKLA